MEKQMFCFQCEQTAGGLHGPRRRVWKKRCCRRLAG